MNGDDMDENTNAGENKGENGPSTSLEVRLAPPVTPPGKKLTEAERLAIENIYLKLQNCQLRVQNLDAAKAATITEMRELQTQMETQRRELSLKYGVDIGRNTVQADGTIVDPKTAQG